MNKPLSIVFASLLLSLAACAQKKGIEVVEQMSDPISDPALTVVSFVCKYMDQAVYIINDKQVIYEDCDNRTYIKANMKSFHIPKYNERGVFAIDKNGIYFQGKLISVDTTGFEIVGINNDYKNPKILWKTRTKVFKNNEEITENIYDIPSFTPAECSNGSYFKDKKFIYYFDKKIEGSDGASVSKSCDNYCYDKNNVYLDGKVTMFDDEKLQPINNILAKTSKYVVTRNLVKQLKMDANSIKPLSRSYAMDKNHVYYQTEVAPILPQNFKNVKVWDQINRAYVSDGIHVYSGAGGLEPDFDAKTFGMLPHSDFCFDKKGIYTRSYIESMKKVVNTKFPFLYKSPVTSENTFITDDSRYIIYENQVYDPWDQVLFGNLTAEQINLAKQNKLSLTKRGNKTLPKQDYDYLLYQADRKIYWNGKETIADAETFRTISNGMYYKDKNRVYSYERGRGLITLAGIDTETAKLFNNFLMDRNFIYWGKTRVVKSSGLALLGIFSGYRMGCGNDSQANSNYYLFNNTDGYWLVCISNTITVRNLGKELKQGWNNKIKDLEIQ